MLTVVDQFTRECICLEVDRAMNGPKVVAALTKAMAERGARPRSLTLDNGSEFAGRAMECWAIESGVQLFHPAGTTGGERLYRELQWPPPR